MKEYLESLDHEVTEVRILRTDRYMLRNGRREYIGGIISGYYSADSYDKLIADIQPFDKDPGTKGIYTTLQAAKPELIARAQNRLKLNAQTTTNDDDVHGFTCFPIDIDPGNPADISASQADLDRSAELAKPIAECFKDLDITFAKGMSGNGYHLLNYITLLENTKPNAEAFDALGHLIAEYFGTDEKIYNPSRIWKLYGTVARKGDSTDERPHRRAKIELPETIERLPFEVLEERLTRALGTSETETSAPTPEPTPKKENRKKTSTQRDVSLKEFLDQHGVAYKEKAYKGSTKYQMDCVFDPSHTSPDAACYESPEGWAFKCSHNSCARYSWDDFRAKIDPAGAKKKADWQSKKQTKGSQRGPGRPSRAEQAVRNAQDFDIPTTDEGKPIVMLQEVKQIDGKEVISERSRDVVSDEVTEHLWRRSERSPTTYRRGVEIGRLRVNDETLAFDGADKDSMAGDIVRKVALMRYGNEGMPTAIANPPAWLAADILRNQNLDDVPSIDAILSHPFFNGKEIIERPGYDPETRTYLKLSKDFSWDSDLEQHSAEADLQLWKDLLSDFPFQDESDFENAIGYMLTLLIRQGLGPDEMVPIFNVTAPREGVGKSLIVKVISAAVLGRIPEVTMLKTDSSSMDLDVGSTMRDAPELIIFDNVDPKMKLDSAYIASVATDPKRKFRLPHTSDVVNYTNMTTMIYTGSNVEVTAEIAKRMVAVRLKDTGIPEKDRKVKIEGIVGYVLKNRATYLSASLRMVKRWIDAGMSESESTTHRMRKWSRIVRGIMEVNGFGEVFLENTDQVMLQVDPEFTMWANAFKAIAEALGETAFTGWRVKDVFEILSHRERVYSPKNESAMKGYTRPDSGAGILDEILKPGNDRSRSAQLGKLLRSKTGNVYGGFRLIDTNVSLQGTKLMKLEPVDADGNPIEPQEKQEDTSSPSTSNGGEPIIGVSKNVREDVLDFLDGMNCYSKDVLIGIKDLTGFDDDEAIEYFQSLKEDGLLTERPHDGEMCYYRS